MNLAAYLHLVWKEYRAVRAFWLSIVVLVVLLEWLISAIYYNTPTSLTLLYTFGLAAPAFFAVGATGAAFSMEQEEGTFDFLRGSPLTARQVFASKLGVAIVATASMFVVLWPLILLFTYPKSPDSLDGMLGLWIMAAAEAIAWGTCFSLLTARPLVAICLALAATSTVTHLLAWSVTQGRLHGFEFAPYLAAVPRRTLVLAVVLAGDLYLGLRWLHGGVTRGEKATPAMARRKVKQWAETRMAEAAAIKPLLLKPDRGAMLAHLFWQHWRQSARLMGLMAGLVFVTLLMMAVFESIAGHEQRYVVVPMAVFAGLTGCCVFLPDQERRRYSFFVEHNVPPRYVWLTRQVPWIVTLSIATLVICLFWVPFNSVAEVWRVVKSATDSNWYDWWRLGRFHDFIPFVSLPPLALGLASVAVSYAAGQWASMFIRSGIMAGSFGLLLSGVLCGWVALMYAMQVSFLWSVAPIPLVLLWATWLRAPDWVSENRRWRARLRAAVATLVPAMVLVIAVPIYRVQQVPLINPGFAPTQYLSQITPEGKATAALYRRADELIVPRRASIWDYLNAGKGAINRAIDRDWLEENARPLDLVLEASRRPTCNFSDPSEPIDRPWLRNEGRLISLILMSGRQFESEGKLDEALDRYFTALRVVSHLAHHTLNNRGAEGLNNVQRVFSELAYWAAQKNQTTERIRATIKRLQAIDASLLRLDDLLKSDYIVARRGVFGDPGAWTTLSGETKPDRQIMERILWGKLMPWEKDRGLRMLNLLSKTALDRLQEMRWSLASGFGHGVIDYLPPSQAWRPVDEFKTTYPYSGWENRELQRVADALETTYTLSWGRVGFSGTIAATQLAEFEARRRGTLLLMAIEAHRLEHGGLPKSLAELVGPYFDAWPIEPKEGDEFRSALPLDPYSGYEFSYFPDGLPPPATPLEAALLLPTSALIPGKPCVWCSGPSLRAGTWEPSREPAAGSEKPKPVVYYTSREFYYDFSHALLPYAAWKDGFWFPIPDEQQWSRQAAFQQGDGTRVPPP